MTVSPRGEAMLLLRSANPARAPVVVRGSPDPARVPDRRSHEFLTGGRCRAPVSRPRKSAGAKVSLLRSLLREYQYPRCQGLS